MYAAALCAHPHLPLPLPQAGAWYEAPFSSRRSIALSLLGGAAALWLFEHSEWCGTPSWESCVRAFACARQDPGWCLGVLVWRASCVRGNGVITGTRGMLHACMPAIQPHVCACP